MQSILEMYEEKRNKINNRKKICILISSFSILILFFIAIFFTIIHLFILIIPFVFCFIIFTATYGSSFIKEVKTKLVGDILSNILSEHGCFDPTDGLYIDRVFNKGLFRTHNKYKSENFVSDTYAGFSFCFSDIAIQRRTSSRTGNTTRYYTQTLFSGKVIEIDLNYNFNFEVCITEPNGINCRHLNVIDIDDYELKEKFIIFASSSEAAYNIITPRVIEVVLKFENLYPGNVSFYFLEGFLYVFINGSRISLNPTLSTPIDESFVDSIYSQVKMVYNIIDELSFVKEQINYGIREV